MNDVELEKLYKRGREKLEQTIEEHYAEEKRQNKLWIACDEGLIPKPKGKDWDICPQCGGKLRREGEITHGYVPFLCTCGYEYIGIPDLAWPRKVFYPILSLGFCIFGFGVYLFAIGDHTLLRGIGAAVLLVGLIIFMVTAFVGGCQKSDDTIIM